MRNLGGTRELAAEYRDAGFGEGPRASWVAAATFLLTSQLLFTSLLVNGRGSSVGGAWTPLAWAIWILATVLVGRLWRVRFRRSTQQRAQHRQVGLVERAQYLAGSRAAAPAGAGHHLATSLGQLNADGTPVGGIFCPPYQAKLLETIYHRSR